MHNVHWDIFDGQHFVAGGPGGQGLKKEGHLLAWNTQIIIYFWGKFFPGVVVLKR